MKVYRWPAVALGCALLAFCQLASAQVEIIGDSQSIGAKIPIAVPPCASSDADTAPLARDLAQVIADDLTFSGLFAVNRHRVPLWVVDRAPLSRYISGNAGGPRPQRAPASDRSCRT